MFGVSTPFQILGGYSWPVIYLVVSALGISHFFTATKEIKSREREKKEQRNNMNLCQLQTKKGCFVTPCIPRVSVDYRRLVFCAKLLQKGTNNADIFLRLLTWPLCSSSGLKQSPFWLLLTLSFSGQPAQSRLLSSALRCRLPSLGSLVNCSSVFSRTFLSSSISGLVGDLEFKPFIWISRQNKEIVCQAYHPHSVTSNLVLL